jgi:hypothetical protein
MIEGQDPVLHGQRVEPALVGGQRIEGRFGGIDQAAQHARGY